DRGSGDVRVRVQDDRRSVRGADQRLPGARRLDQGRHDGRERARPREGAHRPPPRAAGQGAQRDAPPPARRHRRGPEGTGAGDVLLDAERDVELPRIGFPEPVMSFAVAPKAKGDEEKMATGLRRLAEEDPTIQLKRDPQTGEELLSGLSQIHVEVAVERLRRRFGVDVELHQPRVPYLETIRREARAQGKYKKQTGGGGQDGEGPQALRASGGRR